MIDPFFAPIPTLQAWAEPLCQYLNLKTLPLHIHEVLAAFLLYHSIFEYIAPPLSAISFSRYSKLSDEARLRWNMNCVSFVQSVLISLMAIYVIANDEERWNMNLEERIWGYTGAAGLVQALGTGYFLFDFVIMIRYLKIFGLPMLAHAVSCLVTYTIGFRPVCNYYGCVFLLYELSTPFLNVHWFFDKLGMTGSKAQLYNGFILLGTFFSARLVWGLFATVNIYTDVLKVFYIRNIPKMPENNELLKYGYERSFPDWLIVLYMGGHLTLNTLNVYWFNKMIDAVKKRFSKKPSKEL